MLRAWLSAQCTKKPLLRYPRFHQTRERISQYTVYRSSYAGLALFLGAGLVIYVWPVVPSVISKNQNLTGARLLLSDSPRDGQVWPQGDATIIDRHHANPTPSRQETQEGEERDASLKVVHDSRHEDGKTSEPVQDGGEAAENMSSGALARTKAFFSNRDWSFTDDNIASLVLPVWAQSIPGLFQQLRAELAGSPGSLWDELCQDAQDPVLNPEITWDASVRVSNALCVEEEAFLRKRKTRTTKALAKYLEIPENDINPADVPVIAMCGSGGGLRALVAGASSYLSAQEAGLFDCVTYTAGVSGSCWLQTLYYSSIGGQNHEKIIRHLKHRLGVHIAFPPPALQLITSAPTNKYLLSGIVEKLISSPEARINIVDLYGLLVSARLMVPKGELGIDDRDLKLSNQRRYIDEGNAPLPIYTAVRHQIPAESQSDETTQDKRVHRPETKRDVWFQWIEVTPFEFWCEEFGAGIPTWSLGRAFQNGKTKLREDGSTIAEMRMPLLLGIWGSAFCATLSHFYKEIRPILTGLSAFSGFDKLMSERNDDLIRVHPIEPSSIPNYVLGMHGRLPSSCPEDVYTTPLLQLMDAGMSNNLPIYPLLRPGRDVDVLIAFDASADVKTDNWLHVADGYIRQRGMKGWPMGAGWPGSSTSIEETALQIQVTQASSSQEGSSRTLDSNPRQKHEEQSATQVSDDKVPESDLGYCTVWVGAIEESGSGEEPEPCKRVEADLELMAPNAGVTLIYFPFLRNPKVEGVDPMTSEFMSTWNFVYTPEDVDKVVALARANFEEGQEQVKRTIRAVYERKKARRLEQEKFWKG